MDETSLKPQGQVVLKTTADVDAALKDWRQGDCVLEDQWFVFRFDTTIPISAEAKQAAVAPEIDLAQKKVPGLVLVTQTCDIVRSVLDRPFVEVSPLVRIEDESVFAQIRRARRPQFAYIPTLDEQRLVADLDQTMTLEKPVLTGWQRFRGFESERDERAFLLALSRKRSRYAFPDDFVEITQKLQKRISKWHEKHDEEGLALREIIEIRVLPDPSWRADEISLLFWFIRSENTKLSENDWLRLKNRWLDLIPESGRYRERMGFVTTQQEMNVEDYLNSDPFDLNHLSIEKIEVDDEL